MTSSIPLKRYIFGYLLVAGTLLTSCATDSNSDQPLTVDGAWETSELNATTVNNLTTFDGFMYAATDSGLYRREKVSNNAWDAIGLQEEQVRDLVFMPNNRWLAAIRINDFSEGLPSLYLSSNQGESWQPYMNNYGGETGEYTWVGAIATASQPSDTVFARVSGTTVVRSVNGGKNWEVMNGQWNYWGGASVLVKADPYHKNRVWAGGTNAFSLPYLLKSNNLGDTWQDISVLEGVCYDVVSHPTDKNLILAGFFNGPPVGKSTNGGKNWSTVNNEFGTLTFAHSVRNPATVYASGRNAKGTLFFAASGDFGDSWQTVTMPDSPTGIRVNDMVSVTEDGQEVLYFGTNKGVYSYRFEE